MDAVRNVQRLDLSYWKALVSNGQAHLEVILAPPVASIHETLVPDQFRRVLTFLRTAYDWILLDLGRSVNALSLGMLGGNRRSVPGRDIRHPLAAPMQAGGPGASDTGYNRQRLHLVRTACRSRSDLAPGELQRLLGVRCSKRCPTTNPAL